MSIHRPRASRRFAGRIKQCAGFSPRLRGEISSPRAGFLRRRRFLSLRREKERGNPNPTQPNPTATTRNWARCHEILAPLSCHSKTGNTELPYIIKPRGKRLVSLALAKVVCCLRQDGKIHRTICLRRFAPKSPVSRLGLASSSPFDSSPSIRRRRRLLISYRWGDGEREIERGGNGGEPCVRFPQQAPYATSTWRQRRLRNAVQPPEPEPPFPPNPPFAVHGRQRSRADLLPPIVPTPIAGPQPRRSPRLLHQAAVHPIPATATATAAAAAVAISAADAKPAAEFNVAFFDLPDTAEPAAVRFDAATESDPAASRRSGGRQRDAAARRDLRWTDEFRWRPDPAAAAAAAGCRSSRCRNGTVGDDYTGRTDIDAARADCSAFQSAVSDACSGLPMLYRCHFFTVP
ncbi:hypothetical protein BHM03_00013969 [Ensete ventricosum]|nr:hypothetical protein BHM03_00013969 [Ensete ventricosum]